MADKFEQLKAKSQSVLNFIKEQNAQLQNVNLEADKLFIRGAASQDVKNRIWNQIKLVDPSYPDLIADIQAPQAAAATVGGSTSGRTYTVQPGDSLSKISKQFYGDPNQYMKIAHANSHQISDLDKIKPGMRPIPACAIVSSLAVTLFLQLLAQPPTLRGRAPQSTAPGANFNCSSENGRRKYCPTNTRGGVQLVRQRSGSPCTFGQTWGFDRRGVWVDRGCRADFAVGYIGGGGGGGGGIPNWPGWGKNYNVYCASDDGRRNRCPVDTRGGVRLVRQRSGSPCALGTTWGYDHNGVWVDRGCRADFEIGQFGWQPSQNNVVYCASDNMQRNICRINARGGVRIIRQRSDADCIFNRTWGYDQRGIWVDRGCRADFMVGVR